MIRRMIRLVAVAALLLSVGGHWALIQSAAWAGMLLNFAKQGSLRSAVEKTFDGRHACSLCEWVEHEQQNERDEFDFLAHEIITRENFEPVELQRFLALWWTGHIVGSSKAYGSFLSERSIA